MIVTGIVVLTNICQGPLSPLSVAELVEILVPVKSSAERAIITVDEFVLSEAYHPTLLMPVLKRSTKLVALKPTVSLLNKMHWHV